MSEEKNLNPEEEVLPAIPAPAEAPVVPAEEADDERDEAPAFSLDSAADDELPEEIKQKLVETTEQAFNKGWFAAPSMSFIFALFPEF